MIYGWKGGASGSDLIEVEKCWPGWNLDSVADGRCALVTKNSSAQGSNRTICTSKHIITRLYRLVEHDLRWQHCHVTRCMLQSVAVGWQHCLVTSQPVPEVTASRCRRYSYGWSAYSANDVTLYPDNCHTYTATPDAVADPEHEGGGGERSTRKTFSDVYKTSQKYVKIRSQWSWFYNKHIS